MAVLTAKKDFSKNLLSEVFYIRDIEINKIKSFKQGSIIYHGTRPDKTVVYENIEQITQAKEPETYGTAVSSAGSVQGDATSLTRYINVVTGGITNGGVIMPDTNVCRIDNATSLMVKVYPPVGKNFQFLAINAPFLLQPGKSFFFAKE